MISLGTRGVDHHRIFTRDHETRRTAKYTNIIVFAQKTANLSINTVKRRRKSQSENSLSKQKHKSRDNPIFLLLHILRNPNSLSGFVRFCWCRYIDTHALCISTRSKASIAALMVGIDKDQRQSRKRPRSAWDVRPSKPEVWFGFVSLSRF